jgi:hypothetical protein
MSIRTLRRSFAATVALVLTTGLAVGTPLSPAHADVVINDKQAKSLAQLWAKGQAPFTPALSAGPEVGWNAGLEGVRPLSAQYYRLWDMKVAWRDVNPAPGVFDWSILDQRIAQVEAWGGKPIMVLGLTPQWAAADPSAGDPIWGPGTASPPANIETWRAYVKALVGRYGSRIGAYEVWNEANLKTFWTGTSAQMADLVKVAATEIGGSSVVLAPSVTTRLPSGAKFTAALAAQLDAATLNQIDAWSIHTYPAAGAGPTVAQACQQRVEDILRWQLALLDVVNPAASLIKPIWDTEVNFGLAGPGPRPKTAWSDADGAALLNCTYQDSRALGIAVTAWYEYTAADYSLLGVQMNPTTPLINAAWAQLPQTVGVTNSWIPDLSEAKPVSITITGERKTVSGKPGIRIEGTITGVGDGTTLVPYIRFPGQTQYSQAAARPRSNAAGEFSWERKTTKKIYVYVEIEGSDVKSNRIIIPAK